MTVGAIGSASTALTLLNSLSNSGAASTSSASSSAGDKTTVTTAPDGTVTTTVTAANGTVLSVTVTKPAKSENRASTTTNANSLLDIQA